MDRSIGRDGRGRARGWVMDDERRGPSRWMTIDRDDRWVEDDRVDRSRRSARSRSMRADRRDRRVDRIAIVIVVCKRGGGHEMWSVPIAGRRTPLGSTTTRREDRGGGRARGNGRTMRGGGSVVDAFGRGGGGEETRARERRGEGSGTRGRAKAGTLTDEGCFFEFLRACRLSFPAR